MLLTNQSLIETHCNAYLATLLTKLAPLQHDVMLDRVPSGQSYFGHTSSTTKMGVWEELISFLGKTPSNGILLACVFCIVYLEKKEFCSYFPSSFSIYF